MNLRELMAERILFAFTEEELQSFFLITINELMDLSDVDLLELYDTTVEVSEGFE